MPFEFKQVKIYQIDKNFYEFRDANSIKEKIDCIIKYHKENFESPYDVSMETSKMNYEGIEYVIYTFKEKEKISSWKHFLPKELTSNHDFNILSTSFVLFGILDDEIYAMIGGKGISVIKRYYNPAFGIEFLSKICDPNNEVVHSLVARSILGRLTSEQKTYRNEQKLADALSIGTVPKNIDLSISKVLRDSLFDFIDFEPDEQVVLSVSSSFHIKKSIDFHTASCLLKIIHHEYVHQPYSSISRFERIIDQKFCEEILLSGLLGELRNDAANLNFGRYNEFNSLDQDFAHPDKYLPFIEAERYEAYYKGAGTPFFSSSSRFNLYTGILKAFYYSLPEDHSPFDFNSILLGVRVKSFKGDNKQTEAMFINHVSCELKIYGSSFFLIDNIWYKIKGDFIKSINIECEAFIKSNKWNSSFINKKWDITNNESEGDYNLQYSNEPNTLVLDKVLSQEIELCDILHYTNDELFLIHVKKGFDAKMRDLTNQIMISSTRLWNDNKSNKEFLNTLYNSFLNSSNFNNQLTKDEFISLFDKQITFVLAFCNTRKNIQSVIEDMSSFNSNIAKFSLIQHVKEMNSYDYHQLKIIEIPKV